MANLAGGWRLVADRPPPSPRRHSALDQPTAAASGVLGELADKLPLLLYTADADATMDDEMLQSVSSRLLETAGGSASGRQLGGRYDAAGLPRQELQMATDQLMVRLLAAACGRESPTAAAAEWGENGQSRQRDDGLLHQEAAVAVGETVIPLHPPSL